MRSELSNPTLLLLCAALVAHAAAVGASPQDRATEKAIGEVASQQSSATQGPTTPGDVIGLQNPVVYSASIEMVRVPVVVTDLEGAFITGLNSRNFLVQDGPSLQPIEHFVSDNEPTSVGIVLDASAEMAPFADVVRGAAEQIAAELEQADELFLIGASMKAELLSPLSIERAPIRAALDRYSPGETKDRALYDAVALALSELDHSSYDKRALIVFTTGDDSGSLVAAADLIRAAQRLGVTIHAIQMSKGPAASVQELVRLSGGLIARRTGVEDRYGGIEVWVGLAISDICRYVNNQYLLHYTPMSPPPQGMWRRIRVRVDVPFQEVRARSGYVRW